MIGRVPHLWKMAFFANLPTADRDRKFALLLFRSLGNLTKRHFCAFSDRQTDKRG